jgi:hypothetical protein
VYVRFCRGGGEFSLGAYLVVKGFKPSPNHSGDSPTLTRLGSRARHGSSPGTMLSSLRSGRSWN